MFFCPKLYLPGDLTLVNIHTSLAEETSSSLRLLATVETEEVDVRRLTGYLKVANSAVTLCERLWQVNKYASFLTECGTP